MMFVFHFSYDLSFFGYVEINFLEEPFWANFRRFIVGSFLLLVGISIALANRKPLNTRTFTRRLILLIGYALLVSLGSYFMFPESYIYFGILHFIAVASVLGLLFRRFYFTNLALGVGLIVLDTFYSNAFFNDPTINWLGLMTHLPYTEDYVPLIPWFGIVLIGIFIGKALFVENNTPTWLAWKASNPITKTLAFGGRHSLHIYILHQPIFIGLIALVSGKGFF
ncbi:MAG: DUF1624 domain-containing protein [Sulfuriflexus sp.]|nr:DUF1624 domain-containing protein [Sulfuriflexus sp.]